jgi:3-methylfumaryl-CoA hydratase
MVFISIKHEISVEGRIALTEEQDIVYRGLSTGDSPPTEPAAARSVPEGRSVPQSTMTRRFQPDPTQLFRFSALTFNAHRIHYDRDYARNHEGYPGLVVHGPFIATLLMDHYLRNHGPRAPSAFTFRARRPLFDIAPFELSLAESAAGVDLWATDEAGEALSASLVAK